MFKRIVVTGLGPITCIGKSVASLHTSLKVGKSGVVSVKNTPWIHPSNPCSVASIIQDFRLEDYISDAGVLKLLNGPQCRTSQLGIAAGVSAIRDSKIDLSRCNRNRIGVFVGTAGNVDYIKYGGDSLETSSGPRPYSVFLGYPGTISSLLVSLLDIQGPSDTISGGCPSGMDAVGYAMYSIQLGIIDAALVVGSDNEFCELTFNGIGASDGLSSTYNHAPEQASRPFDINRAGNVIGENAGAIFIELEDHAKLRKAPNFYARLSGYAKTSTGTRVYKHQQPDLGTNAIVRVFDAVLGTAGWNPSQVDLISANGSASIAYDKLEAQSIVQKFGPDVAVHSIKGMTGQTGAGCTMTQIMAACLSLKKQIVYGTKNCDEPDPALLPLNIVQKSTPEGSGLGEKTIRKVLCHAIGLGGFQYSCLGVENFPY